MSRTSVRSREVLILLSFFCRDHSTPPLLGSKRGMGSLGWSYADTNGVLVRCANCTVSLQVYRKLVSMCTTHPLSAEVQMFSVMRCHQPTRLAVERASGQHVFAQSRVRSLRVVASVGERWSSSMVTSPPWRSQQSRCSLNPSRQLLVRAGILFGSRRAMVNRTHGTKSIREDLMCPPHRLKSALA